MNLRIPVRSQCGSRFPILIVLSALSVTLAPAAAVEGDTLSWPDGTAARGQPEVAQAAITFEFSRMSAQQRLIDSSHPRLAAAVINHELGEFRPVKLGVVDMDGNLIENLFDGLWAEGIDRKPWYRRNRRGRTTRERAPCPPFDS